MAKTQKKDTSKESAKELFMTGQFTQDQIAEIVGKSRRTIIRWVDEGKWDIILESITTSKAKRIAKYQKYLSDLEKDIEEREEMKGVPTNAEIDKMTKLENIIKKLQESASLGEVVMITKNITLFVQGYDVEKSKELVGIFDAYVKTLV